MTMHARIMIKHAGTLTASGSIMLHSVYTCAHSVQVRCHHGQPQLLRILEHRNEFTKHASLRIRLPQYACIPPEANYAGNMQA